MALSDFARQRCMEAGVSDSEINDWIHVIEPGPLRSDIIIAMVRIKRHFPTLDPAAFTGLDYIPAPLNLNRLQVDKVQKAMDALHSQSCVACTRNEPCHAAGCDTLLQDRIFDKHVSFFCYMGTHMCHRHFKQLSNNKSEAIVLKDGTLQRFGCRGAKMRVWTVEGNRCLTLDFSDLVLEGDFAPGSNNCTLYTRESGGTKTMTLVADYEMTLCVNRVEWSQYETRVRVATDGRGWTERGSRFSGNGTKIGEVVVRGVGRVQKDIKVVESL